MRPAELSFSSQYCLGSEQVAGRPDWGGGSCTLVNSSSVFPVAYVQEVGRRILANGIMQMFSRQMLERRMLDATSASAPASSSPRVAPCTRRSSYSAHGCEVAHDSWLEWVPKWPRRRISTSSFEKHEWKASVLAGTATKTSLNSRHRWKVPSTYRACLRTLRK